MKQASCRWTPTKSSLSQAGSQRCQFASWQSQTESANARHMCIALADNKIVLAAGMNITQSLSVFS